MERLGDEAREILRRLARDHWVRLHGTPRVTVLCGGARARRFWESWVSAMQIEATLLDGVDPLEPVLRDALARAAEEPSHAIAVHASPAVVSRWRGSAPDRLRALVDEGFVEVEESPTTPPRLDARSAAELVFFEALEATPATAGRFELNGKLSVRFGPSACEVDLLSRRDRIAIEIDGYHHFDDPDRYRLDRRKDLLLQTQGLLVIRLLADDVTRNLDGCITAVCQALACREETT